MKSVLRNILASSMPSVRKVLIALFVALPLFASCGKIDNGGGKSSEWKLKPMPAGQLKLMSFNIRGITNEDDIRNNWSMRAGACRMMVEDQQPSVIGLQEQNETQWTYMYSTLSPKGYEGLATTDVKAAFLYRTDQLEVEDNGLFWQSKTPDRSSECWDGFVRPVRWAVMHILGTDHRFFYVTTHVGLTGESQSNGMKLIAKRIQAYNTHNYPVVLMADFNVVATSSYFNEIRETMVLTREVAPITDQIPTYNAWGNVDKEVIIDHIWISKTLNCTEYRTVTNAYDGHKLISDHYPVYAILQF